MDSKDLDTNKIDIITSAAKSVVGIVLITGSLLSELVGNIIPNQRIDRLAEYIKQLDGKLSEIPIEKLQALTREEKFIDLIEEGFVQASRAITNERRDYIANVISNGINDEKIKLEESKMLLKIV